MSINFIADPTVAKAAEAHRQLSTQVAQVKIVDAPSFERAAEWLKVIKSSLRDIEEARTRITAPLNASLREINSQAREAAAPFLATEGKIKAALLEYQQEQEQKRLEEQRRQNEAARREQERLQSIADEARAKAAREAEQRRAEAARIEQEDAAKAQALRDQAAKIEDKAQTKAEAFESRAQSVVAPVAQSEVPQVSGLTKRDNWKARIRDKTKLPEAFKIADEIKIAKLVRSLKLEALPLLGGREAVEIYNAPILASSAQGAES